MRGKTYLVRMVDSVRRHVSRHVRNAVSRLSWPVGLLSAGGSSSGVHFSRVSPISDLLLPIACRQASKVRLKKTPGDIKGLH